MSTKSRTRGRRGRPEASRRELVARAAGWVEQRSIAEKLDELELMLHQIGDYDAGSVEDAVRDHYLCREFVRAVREYDLLGLVAKLAGGEMGVTTEAPVDVIPEPGADPLPHREPGTATDPTGQTIAEYVRSTGGQTVAEALAPVLATTRWSCPACGRLVATRPGGRPYRHTRLLEGVGRVVCEGARDE